MSEHKVEPLLLSCVKNFLFPRLPLIHLQIFVPMMTPVDQFSFVMTKSSLSSRIEINSSARSAWPLGQFGCGSMSSTTYSPPRFNKRRASSRWVYLPGQESAKIRSNRKHSARSNHQAPSA